MERGGVELPKLNPSAPLSVIFKGFQAGPELGTHDVERHEPLGRMYAWRAENLNA